MKRLAAPAALLALLLASGCDRMLQPELPLVYAPWEEGLTLAYENPSLPSNHRQESHFQRRVQSSKLGPHGRVVVETDGTFTSQTELTCLVQDGGVSLGADPDSKLRLLPKGFPDSTPRWEDRGILHWVVGRAAVTLPGVRLADPQANLGVWVESAPVAGGGPRSRTLYLPDVGEAETLLWQDGGWVPVFRLVSRGFTDAPAPLQLKP